MFNGDKIAAIYVDQLEVATPNYDGEGMPHFAGFPGQEYNYDENHDETVDGKLTYNDEEFQAAIAGWQTKRDRGESYTMGTGTWSTQMDAYQELFVGKTVDEALAWFETYCSDLNGRPLKTPGEKTKDEDKAMLADVVAGATMSLDDAHGNILGAIKNALENKVAVSK